jgi:putative colanic acid biosynthesis acetyltransferase WcaF
MASDRSHNEPDSNIPIVSLAAAPGEQAAWDRPKSTIYLWAICELLFIYNPWQISSALRVRLLRAFGAEIGTGVIFRPRTRVKFPWKLHLSDDCWIGEGVWFHNQDHVYVGHDVVISQDSFLTTGSHAFRTDMALITKPIVIDSGAWITARCVLLGGAHIGQSAVVGAGTVVAGTVPANAVWGASNATQQPGQRFPTK